MLRARTCSTPRKIEDARHQCLAFHRTVSEEERQEWKVAPLLAVAASPGGLLRAQRKKECHVRQRQASVWRLEKALIEALERREVMRWFSKRSDSQCWTKAAHLGHRESEAREGVAVAHDACARREQRLDLSSAGVHIDEGHFDFQ
jgi:hypothetical protein